MLPPGGMPTCTTQYLPIEMTFTTGYSVAKLKHGFTDWLGALDILKIAQKETSEGAQRLPLGYRITG